MDLNQCKLSRQEWDSIEIPVSLQEKQILKLIIQGYENVNIKMNDHLSLFSFVKIEINEENEYYLFQKYFEKPINECLTKYGKALKITLDVLKGTATKKLKTADTIRLQNLENNIKQNISNIYEFLLIELSNNLLKELNEKKTNYAFYLYTLIQLKKNTIQNINKFVVQFVDKLFDKIVLR